jgi:hypothetical protein
MLVILQSLTFYLISVITAIIIGLYFYFTRNFNFWQKLGIPYVKPTPFVGNLKKCVLLKTTTGEQLQKIYYEHSDKLTSEFSRSISPACWPVTWSWWRIYWWRILRPSAIVYLRLGILRSKVWRHLRTNYLQCSLHVSWKWCSTRYTSAVRKWQTA